MGVYCDVVMCIDAGAPLDVDRRVRVLEICREHELLRGECAFGVAEDVAPRGVREWLRKHLLRRALGQPLGRQVMNPNGGTRFQRGVRTLATEPAGPWLEARAREVTTDFLVGCDAPRWKDEDSVTQGFRYAALSKKVEVATFDAYRKRNERRGPFPGGDGHVGAFFDILSICARRNLDGRIAARSAVVRALKKELGAKVTCRASWW